MMAFLRRLITTLHARCTNRHFVYAIACVATVSAKLVHIYAHITALPTVQVLLWSPSFFTQDVALLLLLRLLLDKALFSSSRPLVQALSLTVAAILVASVLTLACVGISFFVVAGSELHWRNVVLVGDSSSWSTLLTGVVSLILTLLGILLAAWLLQDLCYAVATLAVDVLRWPFNFVLSKLKARTAIYTRLTQQDCDTVSDFGSKKCDELEKESEAASTTSGITTAPFLLVAVTIIWMSLTTLVRPCDSSLIFMSWTLPLLPILDFAHSTLNLAGLVPFYDTGISYEWDNITALTTPIAFPWLPKDALPGFDDWYNEDVDFYNGHYNSAADPLRVSNLDDEVLSSLKGSLPETKIRHIMLIKLESTRKDVFPFKQDGWIWEKLQKSHKNETLPSDVEKMLANLTPTARFLTGDYADRSGAGEGEVKRRGGISVNKDFTTSTYTLKSISGTLCGISPLVADFNAECDYHMYQPCLPHIFEAFNQIEHEQHKSSEEEHNDDHFTSYPWRSWWLQSVTGGYDRQEQLMPEWGFDESHVINKEYLVGDNPKFGKATMEDINYYGMPEIAIEDYIRDVFEMAEEKKERVFLAHLTSTAHHPFGLPEDEKNPYVSLTEDDDLQDLSKYLNAIHYVDGWLQKILDTLDELKVANETLVVLVGDHGLSLPENGGVTPYYNENVGNFHVPLVFSHPSLPPIDIDDPTTSLQVLPTILDMLLETGSLSASDAAAARDLLHNYEGQSLLRPQHAVDDETTSGQRANWQFTVLNPGRADIGVRDARHPDWKLVVPVLENTEWRFVDLAEDPHELDPVMSFTFRSLLEAVAGKYDLEAARWVEEAAFVSRWWVDENARRWRWL